MAPSLARSDALDNRHTSGIIRHTSRSRGSLPLAVLNTMGYRRTMANGPDAGANRKRPLGTGQLVPPLFAQIRAQQYFLEAVEQEVASVITDLRDNVYPKYCEDKKFSGP